MTFVNATQLIDSARSCEREIEKIDKLAIKIWGLTLWSAAKIFGVFKEDEPEMKKLLEQQREVESRLKEIAAGPHEFTDPYGLTDDEKIKRNAYIKTIDGKGVKS